MKPLFGFNKTTNEEAYSTNLVVKSLNTELVNEYNEIVVLAESAHKKAQNKLNYISTYAIWMGVLIIFLSLSSVIKTSFLEVLHNNLWFIIFGLVVLLVGITLKILGKVIKPSQKVQNALAEVDQRISLWEQKRNEYFEIPEDNTLLDILVPYYVVKNGEMKSRNPLGINVNIAAIFYTDEENIYLSDNQNVFQIPKKAIVKFEKSEEKVQFMYWNRKESYKGEEYAKYNIKHSNSMSYQVMGKGKVTLEFDNNNYYFEVLSFDFDKIESIISDNI